MSTTRSSVGRKKLFRTFLLIKMFFFNSKRSHRPTKGNSNKNPLFGSSLFTLVVLLSSSKTVLPDTDTPNLRSQQDVLKSFCSRTHVSSDESQHNGRTLTIIDVYKHIRLDRKNTRDYEIRGSSFANTRAMGMALKPCRQHTHVTRLCCNQFWLIV